MSTLKSITKKGLNMPTKAELQERVDSLEADLRRMDRALNQAQLDLESLPESNKTHLTPHTSDHNRAAVARAVEELTRVVHDPSPRVDSYIKSVEGIGWSWEEPYTRNGQFAWCGAFAAFCHTAVKRDIRKKIFPSCYRMFRAWANTSRKIKPEEVASGDIVVVYTSKRSRQGDHITLCVDASTIGEGFITTIEGNAFGELGDGSRGEGVITRQRKVEEFAHVYRLLSVDFDE